MENSLKLSADKLFVVTYNHFVVTAVKPLLPKGLTAISAGVLTTYRKTLFNRIFNCDMTFYYLRYQTDFHRAPDEMVDKNIRTDYSKLKMLARIDHDTTYEGSRMSTIEEIAATGEIMVDLHTSFPAERVADIDNFRSLLYYYGLLTMCGTRGDRLKMCIPNNCVREQYFGFLRDYYQQIHQLNLSHLKDLIDDLT